MAKFLNIAVQNLLDSGTDATGTASKLTVASTATFAIGDYVHNTTDATYATITAIDSGTVASLSADIMDAAETYAVYSATASTDRIAAAEGTVLVEQPAPAANGIGTTTINYNNAAAASDVLTLTHVPQGILVSGVALSVEATIIEVHSNGSRPDAKRDVVLPTGVAVLNLSIA